VVQKRILVIDADGCKESYEDLATDEDEFIDQLKSSGWKIVDRNYCFCPKHADK